MSTTFEIAPLFGSDLEAELVRHLQAGNELAYRSLIERYQAKIFRVANRMLGNYAEAEETTQQVFVKAFLSIRGFAGRSSLFTWLHRIAVNECYSVLRSRWFTVAQAAPRNDGSVSDPLRMKPDPRPNSDTVLLQRDYLNRLLQTIPKKDRDLLLLREVEGLSIAELAKATGRDEAWLRVRLCRARHRLAKAAAQLPCRQASRPGNLSRFRI